jgi:hypothetical protein
LETSGIAVLDGLVSVNRDGRQHRISTKETNNKKALKIAEEFERGGEDQADTSTGPKVLDRAQEEVSGERVIRATFPDKNDQPCF